MSWVTIIWSMMAAACLTLVATHGLVWCQNRRAMGNLVFSGVGLMVAVLAVMELVSLQTSAPDAYTLLVRWGHVPVFLLIAALVLFVRLYLHAGRLWLAWTVVAVRLFSLVANFLTGENLNFRTITSMQPLPFLKETVFAPEGVPNPWMLTGSLGLLLLIVFLVDATIMVWRRGERRRALTVGGSVTLSIFLSGVHTVLVVQGVSHLPVLVSPFYVGFIATMSFELSRDLAMAAELARQLQTSEAALRESDQRIDLAVTAANLGLWVWDVARDDVWATPSARHMFGVGALERIDYNRFLRCLHSEDHEPVTHAMAKALNGDGEYEAEYRVVVPGRPEAWIAARGRVEFDQQRKPVLLRGVVIDITERKRAEAKFRLAVQASPSAIVMVDQQGKILLSNALAEKLFGYRTDELVGQSVEVLVPERLRNAHPGHRAGFMAEPQSRAMGAGRELFARRKDGSEFPVEIGLNPIRTQEGVLVLCAIVDITERRRAEQEADQQRNELAHLSRVTTVSELSGSLAHELNQPLAIILSNAQAAQRLLAQQPPDVAEVRDILTDIVSEDRRAGAVIQRLRSLLKRGETQLQPLGVNEIIGDVLRLARSDLIGRGITVNHVLARGLPQVLGDRVQLQQVLLNLILNACDAMAGSPPAQRRLTLMTVHHKSTVRVSVSDTGCGLPPDVDRVFAPFYTTKNHGLGLGLPICRSIVTAHNGRLWAEANAPADEARAATTPVQGATFHFELPVAKGGSNQ